MEKAALRIAFTGPESSGKTTLALWLSSFSGLPYIDEYARTYLAEKSNYEQEDLDQMAIKQTELWPNAGFIADTEMHVFQIWSQVKYMEVSPVITSLLNAQRFDHYFLCAPDIPWEADPLRENPHNRQELFELYQKELQQYGRPFTILTGDQKMRQELIKVKVYSLLNH
jgi:nicotinamide riboside kinase